MLPSKPMPFRFVDEEKDKRGSQLARGVCDKFRALQRKRRERTVIDGEFVAEVPAISFSKTCFLLLRGSCLPPWRLVRLHNVG
jgi:hypothetical protein